VSVIHGRVALVVSELLLRNSEVFSGSRMLGQESTGGCWRVGTAG